MANEEEAKARTAFAQIFVPTHNNFHSDNFSKNNNTSI
jgi:hypothetical protein